MSEKLECPRCLNEKLVRALGNLLVCPNCDLTFVKEESTPEWVDSQQE